MTDFLSRLAQRSMGAVPLIAPRLPSLFAPPEEPNIGVADTAAIIGTPQGATIALAPVSSRATTQEAPAGTEPSNSTQSPQRPAVQAAAVEPSAARRSESDQPRVQPALAPLVQTVQANTPATPQLASGASPFAAPVEPRAEPRNQDSRAAPEPWLPLLPQRKAEPAAVLPAMTDDRPAAEAAMQAAPTVHISIGRVEVRANIAAPPAVPHPRGPSQPTLSLGDYLKRGAGAA